MTTPHPVDSTTRPYCRGIGNHAQDCAAATAAPSWCLPGTVPECSTRPTAGAFGWVREISEDVWIEAEDRAVGPQVMRGEPRIGYSEPPAAGLTCAQARALARALIAAADVLVTCSYDEAAR